MNVYKEQVLEIPNITKIFEIAKTSFTSIKHHKGFDVSKNQYVYSKLPHNLCMCEWILNIIAYIVYLKFWTEFSLYISSKHDKVCMKMNMLMQSKPFKGNHSNSPLIDIFPI
jgi:hypothetical protein